MRAATEVDKFTLTVETQFLVFGQPGPDVLDLEFLVEFLAERQGLVAAKVKPLERLGRLDDRLHLLLDPFKILLADRLVQPDVVVETVVDRRTEGELNAGKDSHHGPGHHVGTTVPHHGQGLGVAGRQQSQPDRIGVGKLPQGPHGIDDGAVDLGSDGRHRQSLTDARGNIECGRFVGVFVETAVGKLNLDHRRLKRVL